MKRKERKSFHLSFEIFHWPPERALVPLELDLLEDLSGNVK